MKYTIYRLTTANGCYSEFTEKAFAEMELHNLINNGKTGTITERKRDTDDKRGELQAMADNRRQYAPHPASDPALIVLLLMETEEHANNYCSALREVLAAFPEVDRDELENELNRFI